LIRIILVIMILFILAGIVKAEKEGIILNQLDKLNLNDLQREVNRINREVEDYLPALDIKKIILNFIQGRLEISWGEILRSILKYLGKEVTANFYILGEILILAVINAVITVFHRSFSSRTISDTAGILLFLVLAVIILQAFQLAINVGVEAIDHMVSFIQALTPVLLSLLVGMGALTSAAIFHPLTLIIITGLSSAIKYIVFPLIFISAVLSIVTRINEGFSLSRLAAFFKELSLGLLGLIMIIFIGGLLLQGGAAAVADSLTLRTAKYLTGTFVPVIGGIFSDAVDLIVSCSLIIKNALNIFGVLAIIFIIAYPIIKIIALVFIYKLASALVQPIADNRLVEVLNDLGNCLVLIFLIVSAVSLMFFIVITVIVGTANLTVMMR
jgi:stage III sporulation protein AE